MFGNVVMEAPDEAFEEVITEARAEAGVETDAELSADNWKDVTEKFKVIFRQYAGRISQPIHLSSFLWPQKLFSRAGTAKGPLIIAMQQGFPMIWALR